MLLNIRVEIQRENCAYRFEYRRVPSSWEGDPAPIRVLPNEPGAFPNPLAVPNGDLPRFPANSFGELLPVEVPDIG